MGWGGLKERWGGLKERPSRAAVLWNRPHTCAPALVSLPLPLSRDCQVSHWKQHKPRCPLAKPAAAKGDASSGGKWLRLRSSQAAPFVGTIPRAHIAQAVASAAGASSRAAPDLSDVPIHGPEEQAAAARRKNVKTFVVKVQVRPHAAARLVVCLTVAAPSSPAQPLSAHCLPTAAWPPMPRRCHWALARTAILC